MNMDYVHGFHVNFIPRAIYHHTALFFLCIIYIMHYVFLRETAREDHWFMMSFFVLYMYISESFL